MITRRIEVQIELGIAQSFEVASCRVEECISETTRAVAELVSTDDLDLDGILAQDARVLLIVDGEIERTWCLKLGRVHFLGAKNDALRFSIELFSPDHLMRFMQDTRKYRKMSARDIVKAVLERSRVANVWRTTRETPRRNYCVQYRETNYDFARRLLEFEGIYYTFDDEGVMLLADRSSASPEVPGLSYFDLHDSMEAMSDGREGIHEFSRGAAVRSGKFTVNDFDWKKPKTQLLQSRETGRHQDLEIYDYPSGYRNIADGEYLARIRIEAMRVEARYVDGRSSVGRFAPAHTFTFSGLAGPTFAGEYLLTRVTHIYQNPIYSPSGGAAVDARHIYTNDFKAIPRDVPFRPACTSPRPNVDGYHTAMVRGPAGEEIHTDKYGRFRAQFHWDREALGTDEDSRWLRVVQESASSMFLARVGWEMTIAYIDGDPDRPLGLTRNINRVMPPAYGQPAKKNVMTIKTPSSPATGGYNEIRLDDSAGAQEFYVRAERDLINIVRNDRFEAIGMNETRVVGRMLQETVERDQSVIIGGNARVETAAMHQLRVQRDRNDAVGGNEQIDVASGVNVQIRGDDRESVGTVRLTIAGGISLPDLEKRAEKALPTPSLPKPEEAASRAGQAAAEGLLDGGLEGAVKGAQEKLESMLPKIPDAKFASKLTGGLSDGVTPKKIIDQFFHGSISQSGKKQFTRLVGGAQITAALGNITTSANQGLTEIVGGAKVSIAAKGKISQSVKGPMALLVGGTVSRDSTGDMSYSAQNSFITVAATTALVSKEKLKIQSDSTIEITADDQLKLTAGGATITMTPGSIQFTGDLSLKSSGKVVVTGKPDNVTK